MYRVFSEIAKIQDKYLRDALYFTSEPQELLQLSTAFPKCFTQDKDTHPIFPVPISVIEKAAGIFKGTLKHEVPVWRKDGRKKSLSDVFRELKIPITDLFTTHVSYADKTASTKFPSSFFGNKDKTVGLLEEYYPGRRVVFDDQVLFLVSCHVTNCFSNNNEGHPENNIDQFCEVCLETGFKWTNSYEFQFTNATLIDFNS